MDGNELQLLRTSLRKHTKDMHKCAYSKPKRWSFENLHLGDYEWLSYGQALEFVCNFALGLVELCHQKEGESRLQVF